MKDKGKLVWVIGVAIWLILAGLIYFKFHPHFTSGHSSNKDAVSGAELGQ